MKKSLVVLSMLLAVLLLTVACAKTESSDRVDVPYEEAPQDSFVDQESENEIPSTPEIPEDTEVDNSTEIEDSIDRPQNNIQPALPDPTPLPNEGAGLDLGVKDLVLEEEKSHTISVFFIPLYEGDDTTIYFESSDESIFTVDDKGKITAVHYGSATLYARNVDGMFVAECSITVTEKPDPNAGVTLDQSEITLEQGQSGKLNATFIPVFDADDLNLTFTSSDTYILTVKNDGSFTTEGYGIVTITVTNSDGKFRASCQVTVTEKPDPNAGLTLDKTTLKLQEGKSGKLNATFIPVYDADSTVLTYSSSNTAIVTVDGKGNIKAVAPGKATVTVTNDNGMFVATCTVTVTEKPYNVDDTTVKVYLTDSKKVVSMSLSDYIVGAMMKEMGLGYERETLRAQVIAIRSYMLYVINNRGAKHTGGATVCDSINCCMAFMSKDAAIKRYGKDNANLRIEAYKELVNSTKNQVVFYNGQVIQAFFHSASYQRTESSSEIWGGNRPYLQSVPSEGTCKQTTLYCTLTQLAKAVGVSSSKFDTSKPAVGAIELTEGGRVKHITIFGVKIDGSEMRLGLELASTSFRVTYSDGKFKFVVMGSGHGVGMSQLGAEAMAERGCTAEQILTHYYTGCTVGTYTKKIG